jgi:hypothetical protein
MIYKGVFEKHKDEVQIALVLFIGYVLSSIIEIILGLNFEKNGLLFYMLITLLLKLGSIFFVGFVFYKYIKKKPLENKND